MRLPTRRRSRTHVRSFWKRGCRRRSTRTPRSSPARLRSGSPGSNAPERSPGSAVTTKRSPISTCFSSAIPTTPMRRSRARLLGWMGRAAEGEAQLLRVLEARPTDVDALLTLEDLRRWQGSGTEAPAKQATPESAPRDRRARLDVGLQLDALDGDRSDWWHADTFLSAPVSETVVLRGGIDQYRRFDENATQATLGALFRLPQGWSVDARATTGFGAEVVARSVLDVELARSLGERVTSRLRGRYSRFAGDIDSISVSPGLELLPLPELRVTARYYLTRITGGRTGHTGSLQLDLVPESRVSPYAFGAFGTEVFAPTTVDEERSRARILTLGTGVRLLLRDDLGLRLCIEYEDLRSTYERLGVGAGLFVKF
ncbi:MAG: YaiO family outer membrane beta-barrel protein [Deltaproteobacteria bacterium]|nr:YaiO family outer membrane beta-barrel protein [Deltaproteobacteria bacterium]